MVKQISEVKNIYDIDTEYGFKIEKRPCRHCGGYKTFQIQIESEQFNDIPDDWDTIREQGIKEELAHFTSSGWTVNTTCPHHTETHYLCMKCGEVNIEVGELSEARFSAYSTRESASDW